MPFAQLVLASVTVIVVVVVGVDVSVVDVVGVVVVGDVVADVVGLVDAVVVVVAVVVGVVQMHSLLNRPLPVRWHPCCMHATGDKQTDPSYNPYPFLQILHTPSPIPYSHLKSHDQQFRAHSHRAPVLVRFPLHSVLSLVIVCVVVPVEVIVVVVGVVDGVVVAEVEVVGVVVGVVVVGVDVAVVVPVVVGVELNLKSRAAAPTPTTQRLRCKKYSAAATGFRARFASPPPRVISSPPTELFSESRPRVLLVPVPPSAIM